MAGLLAAGCAAQPPAPTAALLGPEEGWERALLGLELGAPSRRMWVEGSGRFVVLVEEAGATRRFDGDLAPEAARELLRRARALELAQEPPSATYDLAPALLLLGPGGARRLAAPERAADLVEALAGIVASASELAPDAHGRWPVGWVPWRQAELVLLVAQDAPNPRCELEPGELVELRERLRRLPSGERRAAPAHGYRGVRVFPPDERPARLVEAFGGAVVLQDRDGTTRVLRDEGELEGWLLERARAHGLPAPERAR